MMNALMTRMMVAVATAQATTGNVDLSNVTSPIIGLVNSILNVAIPLVAAVGALYCVLLGVKYAKAEEPQDREKAKQHLKSLRSAIGHSGTLWFIFQRALGVMPCMKAAGIFSTISEKRRSRLESSQLREPICSWTPTRLAMPSTTTRATR